MNFFIHTKHVDFSDFQKRKKIRAASILGIKPEELSWYSPIVARFIRTELRALAVGVVVGVSVFSYMSGMMRGDLLKTSRSSVVDAGDGMVGHLIARSNSTSLMWQADDEVFLLIPNEITILRSSNEGR